MLAKIIFLSPASKNLSNKIHIIYTRFVWMSNQVSEPPPASRPENKSASRIFELVKWKQRARENCTIKGSVICNI